MRLVLITIVLLASFAIIKSYADYSDTFGVRLIPEKMVENSNGMLEVYAMYDTHILATKIKNIVFSSTDSSIVQVVGIENDNTTFATYVKIRANNPGTANIVIAAPGFTSKEFPVIVYGDEVSPTGILIKSTPSTFSINGPKTGYFSIELVNVNDLPTYAQNDIPITVASTNTQILSLSTSHIIIKSGQYYAVGQFEITGTGSATIFASAPSFQSVSTKVVVASSNPPTIQAYVYPTKINDFASSTAYIVAQLKDSSGNSMVANQDIPISVMITNATATGLVNTSPQNQLISANEQLNIKKGDYEGYATIQVNAGLNGTFNIGLSAPEGYLVSNHTAVTNNCTGISGCSSTDSTTPIQISTVTSQLLDDKSAKLDVLPILATGKNELIGIMHLEDPRGNPVIASKDLQIEVDSSDPTYLSVNPVHISRGSADALVFGKVGSTAPPSSTSGLSSVSLHVITYNDITVQATINSSSTNSFKLVADPIVPKILSHSDFPLSLYLVDASNGLANFPNDYQPTILPNDYFYVNPTKISSGDAIDLFDTTSLKDGSTTLNVITGSYSTTATLSSVSSTPATTDLDYPNPLLSNFTNPMAIQVLDSNSNPLYVNSDISLKLISSNDSVILPPTNVTISKGGYYSKFDVRPNLPGVATISVIGNDLPLATYQLKVDSNTPIVSVNVPTVVSSGETFLANVTAERYEKPVSNLNIAWKVDGAIVQSSDKTTNQNGIANIALMSNSTSQITLDAIVSGSGFKSFELEKIIQINSTQIESNSTNSASSVNTGMKSFKINGIDPLPIVVVGSIAAGGILVKKKNIRFLKKSGK